ncbi:Gfo/Idh/MocA family protein [Microbacterium sp.]|uniref:Gfo/Idh/MocA family protein n=1 Tax=Microbacterium sp. TaxID=51671 RepID=UPI003F9D4C72
MTTEHHSRAADSGELRVGLVGAGGISHVHVQGWLTLGVTVCVYSTDGAEALAAEYGIESADTFDAMLSRVDIVDIVTPSSSHREIALAVIAAGKHLVCEKPLAPNTADAMEILDAAQRAGVQVYPAHVVRFFPEYVTLKSAIDAGRLGELAVLRFSRAGEAPASGSWFFDENNGGGIIRDQMIHDLDQARWLAGEVTAVYAVQNPPTVDAVVPSPVTAHVVLTHASGAISHVQGYWGPPGLTFSTSVDVAGSAGVLTYESSGDAAMRFDLPSASALADYVPVSTAAENPYTWELREFVSAFAGGPQPRVSAQDGILAVALAEAAAESIATGQPVGFEADEVLALRKGDPA